MPQQIPDRKLWASLLAATNGEVPATANVFISYAREDGQFVGHLCGALREAGYTPWLDRESIPGSSEWLVEINKGIDNAGAVIVVLSPAACASKFVEEELQYAQKSNRPVVPLQFRQCQLSYGMLWLGQRQYVDLTNDTFLGALQRLDQSLKQLGLVPSPPRREPEPLPQLSQVILGTWEIEMTFQQRSYRLQVTLDRPSSLSGLIFAPPEIVPSLYNGSWSVQEPSEIHFNGHWTAPLSMQPNSWPLIFYIQSISNNALSGFGLPDRAPCSWRRL